jgi:hypothetical protein
MFRTTEIIYTELLRDGDSSDAMLGRSNTSHKRPAKSITNIGAFLFLRYFTVSKLITFK